MRTGRGAALRCLAGFVATGVVSWPVGAQSTPRTIGRELGHMVGDVGSVWISPFRGDARDWRDAAVVAGGFGALLPLDDRVDAWVVAHPRSTVVRAVRVFGERNREIARLPTARRLVPLSAAFLVAGIASDNRKLRDAGLGCLAGWAMSSTLRRPVYQFVSRKRPRTADGDQYAFHVPGGQWEENSFFGGHSANAFACVAFWNERFDLGVAEPALYGVAGGISLARIADRRHWTTDTYLGVVIGTAIGRTIAARQERRVDRDARAAAVRASSHLGHTRVPRVSVPLVSVRF